MRIIDYYNFIATAACILMGAAAIFFSFRAKSKKTKCPEVSDRAALIIFAVIMVIAAAIRLALLGDVPYGLQQDEASIGYDAYTLANFGIDRNGYAWPIYPITWGCGGGSPLLIYLNVLSIKLFGTGIIKLRLIPALAGTATVALFYLTLRIIFEKTDYKNAAALFGAGFLSICPWHVIMSRWSLDCNIMPFSLMLPVYLFMLGAKKKSTGIFAASAALFGLSMYSYGASTIVVPLFLVLICIYCLITGSLNVKQLIISVISFTVVFAPLLWFYCVNYLGFPEFISGAFCVNKLTAARTGEAFIAFDSSFGTSVLRHIKSLLLAASVGDKSHTPAHYYPGYASLYEFTFPITLLGIAVSVKELIKGDKKDKDRIKLLGHAVFLILTLSNAVMLIAVIPDINRMVMLFIPLIYFMGRGVIFLGENLGKAMALFLAVVLIGGMSFTKDYFTDYGRYATSIFMPGYGDAIKRAYEIAGDDKDIYSTYDGLSAPFMLALYYNNYDPYKFGETVVYRDEKAEFRIAESFGNFTFSLPGDSEAALLNGAVLVVSSGDLENLPGKDKCTVESFGGYHVVRY